MPSGAYTTGRTESMQPLDHSTRWDLLSLHCRDTERTKNFPSTAETLLKWQSPPWQRARRVLWGWRDGCPCSPHYSVMCWMVWQQLFTKKTKKKQKASRSERIQTFSAQDNMDQYTENSNTFSSVRETTTRIKCTEIGPRACKTYILKSRKHCQEEQKRT